MGPYSRSGFREGVDPARIVRENFAITESFTYGRVYYGTGGTIAVFGLLTP